MQKLPYTPMERPGAWYLILALVFCIYSVGGNGIASAAEPAPIVRVAVLDLDSPDTAPWLGAAVREAISVKLAGIDGVALLERERMEKILASVRGQKGTATPSRLGVSYLLTGSVQLIGDWSDPEAKIRLTCKMISSEQARICGDNAHVLDGTIGTLFDLETQLAERVTRAMGIDAPSATLVYREERNREALRVFGEGLHALRQARQTIGYGIKPAEAVPEKARAAALPLLETAIQCFRQAQNDNEGAFFAQAHSYELSARDWLARCQPDDNAAQAIREATVKQFRQDAADAAPAFYDLGRALKANGDWQQAIEAFGQYLNWMGMAAKTLRYTLPCHPTGSVYFFRVAGDRVYTAAEKELLCADVTTGAIHWRVPMDWGSQNLNCYAILGKRICVVEGGTRQVVVLDTETGKRLRAIAWPRHKLSAKHVLAIGIHANEDASRAVVSVKYFHDESDHNGLFLFDLENGQFLRRLDSFWRFDSPNYPLVVGDRLFYGSPGRDRSDLQRIMQYSFKSDTTTCVVDEIPPNRTRDFVPLPDGRLIVAYQPENGWRGKAYRLCLDPATGRTERIDGPPSDLPPYPTDDSRRRWRFLENGDLEWYDHETGERLWTYRPAGTYSSADRGQHVRFSFLRGVLLLATKERLDAIVPPKTASVPSWQQEAWIHTGQCLAKLDQIDSMREAFRKAEAIRTNNPDLYRAWYASLPVKPETAKERYRMASAWHALATENDKTIALRAMQEIAGLKFVIPGVVYLSAVEPHMLTPLFAMTYDRDTKRVRLSCYRGSDGRKLWTMAFDGRPANTRSLDASALALDGDRVFFLRYSETGKPVRISTHRLGDGVRLSERGYRRGETLNVMGSVPSHRRLEFSGGGKLVQNGVLQYDEAARTVRFVRIEDNKTVWETPPLQAGDVPQDVRTSGELLLLRTYVKDLNRSPGLYRIDVENGRFHWRYSEWPDGFLKQSSGANISPYTCLLHPKSILFWNNGTRQILKIDPNTGTATGVEKAALALKDAYYLPSGQLAIQESVDGRRSFLSMLRYPFGQPKGSATRSEYDVAFSFGPPMRIDGKDVWMGLTDPRDGMITLHSSAWEDPLRTQLFHKPLKRKTIQFAQVTEGGNNVIFWLGHLDHEAYIFDRAVLAQFLLQPGE